MIKNNSRRENLFFPSKKCEINYLVFFHSETQLTILTSKKLRLSHKKGLNLRVYLECKYSLLPNERASLVIYGFHYIILY